MAEKIKVSELNASTTTNDSDLIMIVQENSDNELENFKQTRTNFLNGIATTSDIPTKVSDLTNDSGYITSSALTSYQLISNLVTSIDSNSTDTQYPSAKCVYDIVGDINTALDTINGESI